MHRFFVPPASGQERRTASRGLTGVRPWAALWILIAVLLLAAFLRLWKLDVVPRGPSHDEANNGLMAGEVLKGYHPVFFEIYTGVEPGLIYPQALAFWALGSNATVQRWVSVAFGLLTVALTYAFAVRLFRSRLVGLLSALLVAVSFWHVFVSRLALRAVVMPPLQILTLLFFWRGLETRSWRDFVLAGLFGGLTMYTYLSSRFLPFIPVAFVLYLLIRRKDLKGLWGRLVLMAAVWFLVFLPLGVYYLENPHWFLFRAEQALAFSGSATGSGPPVALQQTLATLGMFSVKGDPSWRYNLAGRPVFDWAIALAFYAGVFLSIVQGLKKPKLNPYAFILITHVIMLVPDFITDGSPHFLRTIGTVPTTFIFPAIALERMYRLLRPRWRWAMTGLLAAWVVYAGYSTYHDYFEIWAQNPRAREIYNASYAEIADYVQRHADPGAALVSSTDPDLDRVAFSISAGSESLPVRWFDATEALLVPANSPEQDHYYVPAHVKIPDQLSALLPMENATGIPGSDGRLSFKLIPVSAIEGPQQSVSSALGDLVQIVGYDVLTSQVQAGEPLDLRIHWRVMTNPDPRRQWTWFVHLVDERGYTWANWSGQGLEVADWRPGDLVVQHVPLDVPFDAPDISYYLEVGVFDRISGERLVDTTGSDHPVLAEVHVRPTDAASVAGLVARHGKERLGENLVFLGATRSADQVAPGENLVLTLAWSPAVTLTEEYAFALQLVAEDGSSVHGESWLPLGGEYPTNEWPAGRIVRDVLVLTIPPDIPPGRFQVIVSAKGLDGALNVGELLVLP